MCSETAITVPFGLLQRGVELVPAFVRDFGQAPLGVPAGLLPTDVYLGDCPPVLPDFMDDEVSTDVFIPASQKMVMIQALEVSTIA